MKCPDCEHDMQRSVSPYGTLQPRWHCEYCNGYWAANQLEEYDNTEKLDLQQRESRR